MGADLEAEGGDGFEKSGSGVGEMHADGRKLAARSVVLTEAVKTPAKFGGIGSGHVGAPSAGIARNRAGGGE